MYSQDSIFYYLGKINHKNFAYGFALMKEENLHPGQMPLLVALHKEEGLTQRELASRLDIKPSTLNVMIGRLEKNGMIRKKQDSMDQRRSLIYLTQEGKCAFEKVKEKARSMQKEVMEAFTEEEQKEFIRMMKKLCDCFDKQQKLQLGKEESDA